MSCSARPEPEVATLAISVRARQGDRLLHQAVVTALYGSATIVRAVVIAVSFPRRRIFGAVVWRDYLNKRSYRLAATVLVFKRADVFVGLVIGVLVVFSLGEY